MSQTTQLSDIRGRVRLRLDDSSFESTAIDRAINDYQRELTNKHQFTFMETYQDKTFASSGNTIDLPADCQRLLGLLNRTGSPYYYNFTKRYLDYNEFVEWYPAADLLPATPPSKWTLYAGQIRWSAPADQNYTFRLEYLKSCPLLSNDTDVSVIPDEFSEILVEGALVRLQKRDDNYDLASDEVPYLGLMENQIVERYGRGQMIRGPRRMMNPLRG